MTTMRGIIELISVFVVKHFSIFNNYLIFFSFFINFYKKGDESRNGLMDFENRQRTERLAQKISHLKSVGIF